MARVIQTVELPDGSLQDVEVDEAWSADEVRTRLRAKLGLDAPESTEPADLPPAAPAPDGAGQPVFEDAPAFDEQSKPETEPAPSLGERFMRQQELGVRGVALGNPLVLANDILGQALNVIPGVDFDPARELVDQQLTEAGLAVPETEGERVAQRAVEFGAGTALGMGVASTLPVRASQILLKGIGTQVGASVAAGTATQVAAEAGVGPWGQLFIGLAGGMGGGVASHSVLTSKSAAKLGRWADARMETGQPMTVKEVEAVAKAHGLDMNTQELSDLSAAMNKLGNSAKVEAATIDLIHNPKTAVSITDKATGGKRVLTKEEKEIRRDIRKAFEVEADDADYYRRIAHEQDAARETRALAIETEGIERVRAREAMEARSPTPRAPVSTRVDEVRMQAIKERQDAALAQLEQNAAEVASPQVTAIKNAGDARRAANELDVGEVLAPNKDTIRNKQGRIRGTQTFGQKLIKRVHQISPRLGMGMRQVETTANRRTSAAIDAMPRWLGDPKITKAFKKNGEFRRAVSNMDRATMDRLVPGSARVLDEEVVPVLKAMGAERKANGLSVLDDMYPRAVRSVSKVRKAMGREDLNKMEELLNAKHKELGRAPNEDETAGIISQLIGGRTMKQDRSRRIKEVDKLAEQFYVNPRSALIDAIHQFEKAKAKQAFFKNTLGEERALFQNLPEDSIGKVLQRSMDAGSLSSADVHEAARLMSVFYGPGQKAPGEAVRLAKDSITFTTLGFNPFATITQTGDLFINVARFGTEAITQLLPGIGGKVAANAYNAGVRELSSEMRTQQGMARVVRRGLKQFGFEGLDKKFSSTGTKAAYKVRQKQVKDNPAKAREELTEYFGDAGAAKVMDDLSNNGMSDRIAALIANDVADIRPQGGLDLPVAYSKYPNGRLAYSLLSWGINQANFVRNNAVHVMERGIQRGDSAMVARGAKELALMTALFAAGGGSAHLLKDTIKTTISGEQLDPVESFTKGAAGAAIPFGLSGKFLAEGLMSGRSGVLDVIPASSLVNQAAGGIVKFVGSGEIGDLMDATTLGRNIKMLATGTGIMSDAEAGTKQFDPSMLKSVSGPSREAGPSAPLQSGPLPEGTQDLLPERSQTDVDIARMHQRTVQEIEAEQAGTQQDDAINAHIEQREGNVSESYKDSEGKLTGGIGHLLTKGERARYPEGTPIPQEVRDAWFEKDSAKAKQHAKLQAEAIKEPRLEQALAAVNFQLGTQWFKEHKKTWKLMKEGNWEGAAVEAANSKWNKQTPVRVKDLQVALRSL